MQIFISGALQMFIVFDSQELLSKEFTLRKYSDADIFTLVLLVTENWK